jgi:hypothetical protein
MEVVLDNMIIELKGGLKINNKMRFSFRKISAMAASVLLAGMTVGVAAAANYPAPFVSGGSADVAIVYGTGEGVSQLDIVESGNLQSNLQSYMGASSGGTTTSTSGETVALFGNDKIWLNTSLTAGALQQITKTDLPNTLADYTFSGNVEKKLTASIKLIAGGAAGGDNTGKVLFTKQPSTSDDPIVGLSLGTSATSNALYNASITMGAINFTHADSEGEEIELFGQKFTIASATSTSELVLLKEAEKVSLDSDAPTATVAIGGAEYTVELVSASDTSATIKVTNSAGVSASKEVSEAASKKVNGVTIAVQTADETNLKLSAQVIIGAEKLTFTSGTSVTSGDTASPIDGTMVYIVGGPNATTELAVTVFAPETQDDIILPGEPFVDPVFGSFKIDFVGLTSPMDDVNRETIEVKGGQSTATVTMTDSDGNEKEFDFAHNATYATNLANVPAYKPANLRLADQNNYSIFVHEGANLTENDYVVLGNEDYGHLLQVTRIYNNTGTDYTLDDVWLKDVIDSEADPYEATFTAEGTGTVSVDGKTYSVTRAGTGDTGYATIKYPTSDSSTSSTFVMYPTIETKNGALVALYEPLNISLGAFNGTDTASTILNFPDGDGYTAITLTYDGGADGYGNFTVSGGSATNGLVTNMTGNYSKFTIGEFTYNLSMTVTANRSMIYLIDPETATSHIDQPAVMVFEGKDKNSKYHGMVIDLETAPAGTSTDPLGVSDVFFTQATEEYHSGSKTLSGTDLTKQMDYWGSLVTEDASASSQKEVSISYPKEQVHAQIYVGAADSSVSSSSNSASATSLGNVLVKDTEVSSVSAKNLIIVGGSCINAAAATVLGGAYCGTGFTDTTGVGAGEFLLKSVSDSTVTSKVALVVAGYDAADTVAAATYLRTQTVDTGMSYKGTSSTSAEVITEAA